MDFASEKSETRRGVMSVTLMSGEGFAAEKDYFLARRLL